VDFFLGNLRGNPVGFLQWRKMTDGNIPGAIRQDDQQRHHIRMQNFFLAQNIIRQVQPCREGSLSANWDVGHCPLCQDDGIGGWEHLGCPVFLKDNQSHPVPSLVGIGQQGENGTLGGSHPFCNRHRPGGIHEEQD